MNTPILIDASCPDGERSWWLESASLDRVLTAWIAATNAGAVEITLHATDDHCRLIAGSLRWITSEVELLEWLSDLCVWGGEFGDIDYRPLPEDTA